MTTDGFSVERFGELFQRFLEQINEHRPARESPLRQLVSECVYTVFEEESHHNRYALRDLALLE